MKMRSRAAIVLALLAVQWGAAATYYVATTGNNSDAGTESAPWLTIQKFLDTAATGDTCRVRAGTYTGSAGLTLTRATHENKTMTIEAYGDGAVIVTDTAAAQAALRTGTTWTQAATYTFRNIEFRPAAVACADVNAAVTVASQWPVVGEQRAMNFRIGAFQTEPGERCTVRVRTSFDVMTN